MSRDRLPRRRRDEPQELPREPAIEETRKPLYRIKLSEGVRKSITRNVVVDVEVCATGEPCARSGYCGSEAHVRVIVRGGGESETHVLCADHWLAVQEVYDAMAGGHVSYGLGALDMIAMRRTPHPSDRGENAGEGEV